jgi:hypothetical protein
MHPSLGNMTLGELWRVLVADGCPVYPMCTQAPKRPPGSDLGEEAVTRGV